MGAQITLTLPDELLTRANLWADRMGRPVQELLAEAIELSLQPLGNGSTNGKPIEESSDGDVLAASKLELSQTDDQRLSQLLDHQQTGSLIGAEHAELQALMQVYQEKLLFKAQALREAVRRGLRGPLPS